MNTILDLNKKLFDTFDGLESGQIDVAKAKAITGISNAIINNAKLALQLATAFKSKEIAIGIVGKENIKQIENREIYDKKLEFAISCGYNNVAEAIGEMGKFEFEQKFKQT
ncbi:MAG: hypothetical protein LBE36_06525 [Flavobacteriaceae bacterium]|jgi:hypothetical protein|nr:hypothetical protein [Flavobacteriaceae bacterium]